MITTNLFCEGKTKQLYKIKDNNRHLVQVFKDDVTAFNGKKHEIITNKGFYCNQISSRVFEHLEKRGIHTHYISRYDDISMLIKKTKPILLEVVVRKYPYGSLVKRLGLDIRGSHAYKQGGNGWITKQLTPRKFVQSTIIELFYKNDELGDPLINDDHAICYVTDDQTLGIIKQIVPNLFREVEYYFKHLGFQLDDAKFEFGVDEETGEILVIDDISPEGCRLNDLLSRERFDKDLFRFGLEYLEKRYPVNRYDTNNLIGHNGSDFRSALESVYGRIHHIEKGGRLSSLYDGKIFFEG